MRTTVDAIYAGGILRPLRALDLPENSTVRVVVETGAEPQGPQPQPERAEWLAQSERSLGACRTYVCVLKSTLQNARYRVFIQI
jgi:predicted DNA-binding antitoxin AbrB/MazE fold protein